MSSTSIPYEILANLAAGSPLTPSQCDRLKAEMLADVQRARAFGIDALDVADVVESRLELLCVVYPEFLNLQGALKLSPESLMTLWDLWLPLTIYLAEKHKQLGCPLIQGVLGGQGTGKTTLAAVLKLTLQHLGYRCIGISLDDLYKTYADRQKLKEEDPRLIWRGPPGTHDIQLGIEVLEQLQQMPPGKIAIPRFDKSAYGGAGDRAATEEIDGADIVLFEGWFVGARPVALNAFDNPPPPILSEDDTLTAQNRQFAIDMNAKLQDYLPLWEKLEKTIVLYPTDYRLSLQWRLEAEHKAIAAGLAGMSDAEIGQFVEYFWRSLHPEIFIQPMIANPELVDLVIEINPDRSPGRVYKP